MTGLLLVVIVAGFVVTATVQRLTRPKKTPAIPYPRISTMRVHHIPCMVCGKPLIDGDQIIAWKPDLERRSDFAHVRCAVYVLRPNGGVTTVDGTTTDDAIGPGKVLLTQSDWERFQK